MNLSITELVALRVAAKEREEAAVAHRREIDAALINAIGTLDEGTKSEVTDDYKVSVTYKLDRKLDTDALRQAWPAIPAAAQNAVKWKADLSVTEYRKLEQSDAGFLSQFITTKPAAPTIKVEPINKEQ